MLQHKVIARKTETNMIQLKNSDDYYRTSIQQYGKYMDLYFYIVYKSLLYVRINLGNSICNSQEVIRQFLYLLFINQFCLCRADTSDGCYDLENSTLFMSQVENDFTHVLPSLFPVYKPICFNDSRILCLIRLFLPLFFYSNTCIMFNYFFSHC